MRKLDTTVALYAGSFDPITKGHLDVLGKALKTFDVVYVAIGQNPKKTRLFNLEESKTLIAQSINDGEHLAISAAYNDGRVQITDYVGMSIIKYANEVGASHIVRGLRQAGDFNDEFALTGTAGRLNSEVCFTHFICQENFLHVSSSTARELSNLKEDTSWLVTKSVEEALRNKFNEN